MPDDISIPQVDLSRDNAARSSFTHSYRARRTGMDATTRRLFMAASALGLVLIAGMGIWSFSGRTTAGVPVIPADGKPLRVKPDNPGGMSVIGANEQLLGPASDARSDMAPAAEEPDPQALRAQRQVARTTAPAVSRPGADAGVGDAAPVPAPAPHAAAEATPAPSVAPPVSPPVSPPAPAAARVVAPPAKPATGGTMVQLAAVDSEAGATAEWQRLAKKMPDLLGDRHPALIKAERDGKSIWRVRTGGFADMAEAAQFCQKVRAKGGGCSIANF